MADTTPMTRAEFAQKIKAQYPVYADIPDDELTSKMLAKYPVYASQIKDADVAATTPPDVSSSNMAGKVGLAAAGAAKFAGPIADAASAFAESPAVRPIGSQLGRWGGGLGAVYEGYQLGGIPGALGGLTMASNAAWGGGRIGWRTAQLLQNLTKPAAKAVAAVAPYAEMISGPLGAMSAESDALTRLNDPVELQKLKDTAIRNLTKRMNAPDLANNERARAGIAASIKKLGGTP